LIREKYKCEEEKTASEEKYITAFCAGVPQNRANFRKVKQRKIIYS